MAGPIPTSLQRWQLPVILLVAFLATGSQPQTAQARQMADEAHILDLGEPARLFTVGGNGRLMAFHLKEAKKVVVVDLVRAEVAHEIPNVADDVLLAAGAEDLVLVLPGQRLVQRWSLVTSTWTSPSGEHTS